MSKVYRRLKVTPAHEHSTEHVGDEFYIGGIRESWWGFIEIVVVACIRELSHALFRVGLSTWGMWYLLHVQIHHWKLIRITSSCIASPH